MAKRLIILAVLLLIPGVLFAASGPAPAAPTASGFMAWLNGQSQAPSLAASCGSDFCTQQQRSQCEQSCHTPVHVGLQCCTSTCTTICNCGSRPIGC
jgi:hypothetical protein